MKCIKKRKNAVTLDAGGMECPMTGAMGRAPSYKIQIDANTNSNTNTNTSNLKVGKLH